MKILIFAHQASNLTGFRYELLKSLVKSGIEVFAVAPPNIGGVSEKMSEIGVKYEPLDYDRSSINPFKELGIIFAIMSIIKREKPDVMFSFMMKPVVYGSIAAKLCGVKYIQSMIEGLGYMFIGRLLIDKGVKEFIEAAKIVSAKYPQAKFALVGDSDANPASLSSEEIREYAKIKSIKFAGNQSDVRPYLKECAALVLPSSYREGMPVSPMEAMACARCIIVSNGVGCKELISRKSTNDTPVNGVLEGKNGYMVEKGNAQAVAKAMIDLIENPHKIEMMGKEGRKFAEEFLDQKKINKILVDDIMSIPVK